MTQSGTTALDSALIADDDHALYKSWSEPNSGDYPEPALRFIREYLFGDLFDRLVAS